MQNLLAFLTRYYHWLLFIFLEVVSGVLLFRGNSYQGSVMISSANVVTGKVSEWSSSVEQFFSLRQINEQLTERNIMLEAELQAMREQALADSTDSVRNRDLPLLSQYRLIPAKVISNQVNRPDNLLTIDRGTADGVKPDMGVACGQGVVGVVYMASQHYSVVIPVLNSHSRISCVIRDRNYFGYLVWKGGKAAEAYMEDVPRHAFFDRGEWVETSGFSAIFPPGLSVGRITNIGNSADGLSYSLRIRLSTDFARLRDVCVIADSSFAERNALLTQARDSLSHTH